ncbi:MAG TPA: HAMP domain-containing sensor histidine kinase [Candidatus Nitrosocosmicus sp.]|nr:HAMP domain-containing sensor histidine kinase [Candidatus Nitrosocosmicus sp.]
MAFLTDSAEENQENTEVLYGIENTISKGVKFMQNAKEQMDLFGEKNGPSIIIEYPDIYKKNYIAAKNRGVKIRFITEITTDNIHYCKEIRGIVTEMRHLEGLTGGIAVTEKEYMTTTTLRNKQLLTQVFYSNAFEVVKQGQYIFDTFWEKATPAERRIKEIEEGIDPEIIENIKDPLKIQDQFIGLLKSSTRDIMLIVPTTNALKNQYKIGILQLLKELVISIRNLCIRILTPLNKDEEDGKSEKNNMISLTTLSSNVQVRSIEETKPTMTTAAISMTIIIDRKESFVIEIKDNSKGTFVESIGFATYSNSKPSVLSYISIFESFWLQTEMYKKVKETEQMQRDFINIAAHELRTPIQPILGFTEIVKNRSTDRNQKQLLEIVSRNAKKLKQLTDDILEASKIENKSPQLNKEYFNLNELIQSIIDDFKTQMNGDYENILKLEFIGDNPQIFINADKSKINQVIYNLINNSIKFTIKTNGDDKENRKGEIITLLETKDDQVIVTVKDNGQGIDKEIFPKLFTKFIAKPETGGTGLGLYISKSIIEQHGGKIWAENKKDFDKGAIFRFRIPIKE